MAALSPFLCRAGAVSLQAARSRKAQPRCTLDSSPLAGLRALGPRCYRPTKAPWEVEDTLTGIQTLELAAERTSSWSCVISVTGELDRVSAPSLRELIDEQIADERIRQLVLDLTEVDFMDGGGLRLLLDASEAMRKAGRRFCVVCTNPHVLRLFTLVDVRGQLNVVRSRASVLANGAAS